jgi:hypothetical protein
MRVHGGKSVWAMADIRAPYPGMQAHSALLSALSGFALQKAINHVTPISETTKNYEKHMLIAPNKMLEHNH